MSLLTACSRNQAIDIEIEQSWIPAAPPSVDVLAGYFTLTNHLNRTLVLVSAESPWFEYIELHSTTSIDQGRLVQMNKLSQVEIAAGKSATFKPGGNHLMLYRSSRDLKPDQQIPVTLVFEGGVVLESLFKVTRQQLQPEQGGWF